MRKTTVFLILILGIVFGASGQNGPMDLVVILDTSASMSDSYKSTGDYLSGPFLKEFLRIGDTFHLISFSKTPKVEISRRIEGIGDIETIIGRFLLMYPINPDTDIAGALAFAEKYAASLPGTRHRKIILISDGDGGGQAASSAISSVSDRLKNQNADLQFIKIPLSGPAPVSGRPPAETARGQAAQSGSGAAGSAAGGAAASTGTAGVSSPRQETAPVREEGSVLVSPPPPSPSRSPGTAESGTSGALAAPEQPSSGTAQEPSGQGTSPQPGSPPDTTALEAPPPQEPSLPPTPSQVPQGGSGTSAGETAPAPIPPSGGTTAETSQSTGASSFSGDIPLPLIIGLIILALIILALIIFFASRNLHSSPNRVMAQAAAPQDRGQDIMSDYAQKNKNSGAPPLSYPSKQRKTLPKDKPLDQNLDFDNGPPMLSLFVADQNTAIGRRNIHAVKPGYTFTVGGGKSDFLIFLVPIPPHIADVYFDGRQCTFIPRKPQYFPDIGSQQVLNCIGKTIRVISDKNYELHIRIERYEDPLKALNKLLHSIQVPG
ncbi:MAG: VWA domain-containing protein [Treponema sp.]|jgi:hypothetical protein|nr:VWA domain-containing protein [Treponema sp.]